MSLQHGIKKIRNSLLASRVDSPNRKLRRRQDLCYWKHWEDAYLWDQASNPLRLHRKLTDEHIYVTDSGKMRNHLAFEVLDNDMLILMEVSGIHVPCNIEIVRLTHIAANLLPVARKIH